MGNWKKLLPTLSDEDRRQVEIGLAEADARIRAVLHSANTYHWRHSITNVPVWGAVESWPVEERRSAALAMHLESSTSWTPTALNDVVRSLADGDLPWTRADLVWCLEVAAWDESYDNGAYLELPAAIAARLAPAELADLVPVLDALINELVSDYFVEAEPRRRAVRLIGDALDRATGRRVPSWLLHDGDGFGPLVRAEMSAVLAAPGVPEVLAHCAALEKPAAPAKWQRRLDELLATTPGGAQVVRSALEAFAAYGRPLHDDSDRLVRGLVWALSRQPDEPATDLLARVTAAAVAAPRQSSGSPHAQRTAVAAVQLLASREGEVPVRTLARLAVTVRNKALQNRIQTALTRIGALRGWSLSEVMELAIDDHGLGLDGRLCRPVGPYEATVDVLGEKAHLTFARDGVPLKGIPAQVKQAYGEDLKQLRDLVKRVGVTLAAERQRVEGLLSEERTWSYPEWSSRLLAHPITGAYGRRLLWETSTDGQTWTAGLPRRDGDGWMIAGLDGQVISGDRVRLWHPARSSTSEVLAWREHVVAAGLAQPFKQAFREVYLVTPAEEGTHVYSNRFAAHILRYRQANALMRARGWQAGYLGTWDGGYDSEATKLFGGGAWRASFHHQLVDNPDPHSYDVEYCSTDQVRFARRDGATWQEASVVDVPPLVFTEAMRDVDLFVGVTSIATDPQWADRGEDRLHTYWHSTVTAALTPSAEVRRDALARLLPRTNIADRVDLFDRYLHVRGNVRTYRIHLGSGNVMMEPDDSYLCIVPARDRTGRLHLPFDDDPMLSTILSKAMMLAADDTITDTTVLRQLSR
ncbi:DUF4132 domain-containing protein [Micromonospora parathelypteridis]|uniref:DUF4132 domain-containing protein n=1 Tax=Micromonospora parathelypteridis TaxID=1839617 RepID=A0A840VVQ7_9ACTN|nr:DUF4132 domain-containing protein [Micromonospora parathelypteridis]MBB5480076.1 hypothetical protein [Micromonospora parathelypteridis]GGO25123.1 hypothetical protein GCM10011576_47360 [Micromonospora parathelypteridis]